jgi:hypothetical protein
VGSEGTGADKHGGWGFVFCLEPAPGEPRPDVEARTDALQEIIPLKSKYLQADFLSCYLPLLYGSNLLLRLVFL